MDLGDTTSALPPLDRAAEARPGDGIIAVTLAQVPSMLRPQQRPSDLIIACVLCAASVVAVIVLIVIMPRASIRIRMLQFSCCCVPYGEAFARQKGRLAQAAVASRRAEVATRAMERWLDAQGLGQSPGAPAKLEERLKVCMQCRSPKRSPLMT